jgi:excinuclease ABC subunit C
MWLIPYINPLDQLKGKEFFRLLPQSPGVYLMLDESGAVLYVGKAKNLRSRLSSYRLAHPDSVSRKVIRMLNCVREIRWEICESEKDALLRENHLLRELQPPFNVVNTSPGSYYFIGLRVISPTQVRFRLTTEHKSQGDTLYGAFKGRGSVRAGYGALLRLIWNSQNDEPRYLVPARLARSKPVYIHTTLIPEAWVNPLKRLLAGTSDELLAVMTASLLENESIPRFAYRSIQDDLETVREFFEHCPRRNRELRRNHGLRTRLIPQDSIDDLMILELARAGKIDRPRSKS